MRWLTFGCASIAVATGTTGAAAESIRFSYEAPESGCPTEAALTAAIAQDGGHIARASAELPARSFLVTVEVAGDVTGHLVVRSPDGHESTRSVRGARCDDVVRSLAVLVSLALEPDSRPPAAPAPASPNPPPPRMLDAKPDSPPEQEGPLPPGWRLGASAEGTLSALASQVATGFAAYVDIVHDVPNLSAFALRIGGEIATAGIEWGSGGKGPPLQLGESVFWGHEGLVRRVARVETCPLRAVASRPWSSSTIEAWACARFDVGEIKTTDLSPEARSLWEAAGSVLRVRFVNRRFLLDLEGDLMFPLTRDVLGPRGGMSVFGAPSNIGYRVQPVLGGVGIGVGWFLL